MVLKVPEVAYQVQNIWFYVYDFEFLGTLKFKNH